MKKNVSVMNIEKITFQEMTSPDIKSYKEKVSVSCEIKIELLNNYGNRKTQK